MGVVPLACCLLLLPLCCWCGQVHNHNHDNNWAIIVTTSRYWFNYRHYANTFAVYTVLKKFGIPDSNILVLNTLDIINDQRNPKRGELFISENSLHGQSITDEFQVDYRKGDASADTLIQLLTARPTLGTPSSKTLQTNENSNLLIYVAGHGGDQFLKFHDVDELNANYIAYALKEMKLKGKFKEVLLIIDSCQASTMADDILIDGVTTIASSQKGENSYAYKPNPAVGVPVLDRFTYGLHAYFMQQSLTSTSRSQATTWKSLLKSLPSSLLFSRAIAIPSRNSKKQKEMYLTDFLGANHSASFYRKLVSFQVEPLDLSDNSGPKGSYDPRPDRYFVSHDKMRSADDYLYSNHREQENEDDEENMLYPNPSHTSVVEPSSSPLSSPSLSAIFASWDSIVAPYQHYSPYIITDIVPRAAIIYLGIRIFFLTGM